MRSVLGIGSTELNLIILQSYAHILTPQHEASLRGSFGRHEDTRHGIVISARLGALPALGWPLHCAGDCLVLSRVLVRAV